MDVKAYTLSRQLYGLQMSQCVYGGPRGVWLECTGCNESQRVSGPDVMDLSDVDVSRVYRANGWTGIGHRMLKARCPKCSPASTVNAGRR